MARLLIIWFRGMTVRVTSGLANFQFIIKTGARLQIWGSAFAIILLKTGCLVLIFFMIMI